MLYINAALFNSKYLQQQKKAHSTNTSLFKSENTQKPTADTSTTPDNSWSASYNVIPTNTRMHSAIVNSYQPSQYTNCVLWQLTKLTSPSIWDDSSRKRVPTWSVGDKLGPGQWTAWRGDQRSEVTWITCLPATVEETRSRSDELFAVTRLSGPDGPAAKS